MNKPKYTFYVDNPDDDVDFYKDDIYFDEEDEAKSKAPKTEKDYLNMLYNNGSDLKTIELCVYEALYNNLGDIETHDLLNMKKFKSDIKNIFKREFGEDCKYKFKDLMTSDVSTLVSIDVSEGKNKYTYYFNANMPEFLSMDLINSFNNKNKPMGYYCISGSSN